MRGLEGRADKIVGTAMRLSRSLCNVYSRQLVGDITIDCANASRDPMPTIGISGDVIVGKLVSRTILSGQRWDELIRMVDLSKRAPVRNAGLEETGQ